MDCTAMYTEQKQNITIKNGKEVEDDYGTNFYTTHG
jgi:hypothetical protein